MLDPWVMRQLGRLALDGWMDVPVIVESGQTDGGTEVGPEFSLVPR